MKCVEEEIEVLKSSGKLEGIETLYIGGGTPSLLRVYEIQTIMEKLNLKSLRESTMEANPESLLNLNLREIKSSGINRISIGVQSLIEDKLKFLGRIHTRDESIRALERAMEEDFSSVSADIITGLPGEKEENLLKELSILISMNVPNISLYYLTPEPETPLWKDIKEGKIKLPHSDELSNLLFSAWQFLEKNGYEHYEVSTFSLPGKEPVHNTIYWSGKFYMGIGAGASSYLEISGEKFRLTMVSNLTEYMKGEPLDFCKIKEMEKIDILKEREEYLFLSLRWKGGIRKNEWESKGGDWEKLKGILLPLVEEGYLFFEEEGVYPSDKGMLLADEICLYVESFFNERKPHN